MKKIPFALLPPTVLARFSKLFYGVAQRLDKRLPQLSISLTQAEAPYSSIEYLSLCLCALVFFFLFVFLAGLFAIPFGLPRYTPLVAALLLSGFAFLQQISYPKLYLNRRVAAVEKNLLPALQDMLVQLDSGIPLFNILVNLAEGDYGEISHEFDLAVKEINAGQSQIDALEDIALKNPSVLFRRTLWQLVNGMKEGADISSLLKEVMKAVSDEQLTQIQRYGSQLSPLALFYMLIAIIAPSLGVTFIIILSSFINLSSTMTKVVFYAILVITVFFQIAFLGMIKTRRPTLLG